MKKIDNKDSDSKKDGSIGADKRPESEKRRNLISGGEIITRYNCLIAKQGAHILKKTGIKLPAPLYRYITTAISPVLPAVSREVVGQSNLSGMSVETAEAVELTAGLVLSVSVLCLAAALTLISIGDAAVGIYIIALGFIYIYIKLTVYKNAVSEKLRIMAIELSDILNMTVILLDAGLGVRGALANAVKSGNGCLHTELYGMLSRMEYGASEMSEYRNLVRHCPSAEISVFISIIRQDALSGSRDIISSLKLLSQKCRENRKIAAFRAGEKLKAKLLLPQTIVFICLICMVAYPAFIALRMMG